MTTALVSLVVLLGAGWLGWKLRRAAEARRLLKESQDRESRLKQVIDAGNKAQDEHEKRLREIDGGVDASRAGELLSTYPNERKKTGAPRAIDGGRPGLPKNGKPKVLPH